MDFNDENRTPIDFSTNKHTVHNYNGLVVALIIVGVALVALLIVLFNISSIEATDSTKIEIGLSMADVKVDDKKTCTVTDGALTDASNVKLSYKKSTESYFNGDAEDQLNDDGSIKEVDDKDKIPGVDLVIEGITDKIYAYVEYSSEGDDGAGIKYTHYQAKDGKIIIPFSSHKKTSVSVYIYATDEACEKLLKHYDVVLPMYNALSTNSRCSAIDANDTVYCSEYSYEKYNENVFDNLGEVQKQKIKINLPAIAVVFVIFIAAAIAIYVKLR